MRNEWSYLVKEAIMIKTHMEQDFPVGNIVCETCRKMAYFSHEQSTDSVAVFYCNNELCSLYGFFLYHNEMNWFRVMQTDKL